MLLVKEGGDFAFSLAVIFSCFELKKLVIHP
jgi:hypothetical protein